MDATQITQILKSQLQKIDPTINFETSDSLEYYQDVLQEVNQHSSIESFQMGINLMSEDTGGELNSNITIIKFNNDLSHISKDKIKGYIIRNIMQDLISISFLQDDLLIISLDY